MWRGAGVEALFEFQETSPFVPFTMETLVYFVSLRHTPDAEPLPCWTPKNVLQALYTKSTHCCSRCLGTSADICGNWYPGRTPVDLSRFSKPVLKHFPNAFVPTLVQTTLSTPSGSVSRALSFSSEKCLQQ